MEHLNVSDWADFCVLAFSKLLAKWVNVLTENQGNFLVRSWFS